MAIDARRRSARPTGGHELVELIDAEPKISAELVAMGVSRSRSSRGSRRSERVPEQLPDGQRSVQVGVLRDVAELVGDLRGAVLKQVEVYEVGVAPRGPLVADENVQQGALPGSRTAQDG